MKFRKFLCAGQDIIFIGNENYLPCLDERNKKRLCDRQKGIGGNGIVCFEKNCPKMPRIKAFDKNGLSMPDVSSALICAVLEQNMVNGCNVLEIVGEKQSFFAMINEINGRFYDVTCAYENLSEQSFNSIINRRTELGNRILTLTYAYTSAHYAVHFSSDMSCLDIKYISDKTRKNSIFRKSAELLVAEKTGMNSYVMSKQQINDECAYPSVGAFAAVAVAACKDGKSRYSEEIKVSCEGYDVYVFVKDENSFSVHTRAEFIYEGEISVD